jgi:rSAM/selenodomain-associated transferase 1
LEHLKAAGGIHRYLAFAPSAAATLMRELAGPAYDCIAQQGADLGARMNQVFLDLWQRGHRNIVLIGSDLPALPLQILNDAFARLSSEEDRIVLGPSRDGGYYLIGMNQPAPEIFENMTWSHDQVLAQTVAKLTKSGVKFSLLPACYDLDTLADLKQFHDQADAETRIAMPRTWSLLSRLEGSMLAAEDG